MTVCDKNTTEHLKFSPLFDNFSSPAASVFQALVLYVKPAISNFFWKFLEVKQVSSALGSNQTDVWPKPDVRSAVYFHVQGE